MAVPTPVKEERTPDLTPVESASLTLGRNLTKGSVVVFESTVYPGITEDICVRRLRILWFAYGIEESALPMAQQIR